MNSLFLDWMGLGSFTVSDLRGGGAAINAAASIVRSELLILIHIGFRLCIYICININIHIYICNGRYICMFIYRIVTGHDY